MKITKNFTLTELTKTNTGLVNKPNREQTAALVTLCGKVLQPARNLYNAEIFVTSGFRSEGVNRAVGGAKHSQHKAGEAADITVRDRRQNHIIFELIRDNLDFDQLINEKNYSWIHVSYKSEQENRNQVLNLE